MSGARRCWSGRFAINPDNLIAASLLGVLPPQATHDFSDPMRHGGQAIFGLDFHLIEDFIGRRFDPGRTKALNFRLPGIFAEYAILCPLCIRVGHFPPILPRPITMQGLCEELVTALFDPWQIDVPALDRPETAGAGIVVVPGIEVGRPRKH